MAKAERKKKKKKISRKLTVEEEIEIARVTEEKKEKEEEEEILIELRMVEKIISRQLHKYCHKLHLACISTTNGLIFTN